MKALGIGLGRILMPVFICASALSALAFFFTDYVVPQATLQHNRIDREIRSQQRSDGSRRQVLLQDRDGQLIFARSYDANQRRADEVSWERLHEGRPIERLVARHIQWQDSLWIAYDGRHYAFGAREQTETPFESFVLNEISLTPSDFARQHKDPDEMNYAELETFIDRATQRGRRCGASARRFTLKGLFSTDLLYHYRTGRDAWRERTTHRDGQQLRPAAC